MASDDRASIRLELLQAVVVDERTTVCLASWPRPSSTWSRLGAQDIEPEDLDRWNVPFSRDAFEFYVTAADYDPAAVEYVADADRLLVRGGSGWKAVGLGQGLRSLCRVGSDVFGIGARGLLGVVRKGKWAELALDAESADVEKNAAANVGSRIIAGGQGGVVLELVAAGRRYRWNRVGEVSGDIHAVAGTEPDQIVVGGAGGVHFQDQDRWRQIMRGFHGFVTCLTVLPTGEILAGTSTGEIWAGTLDGMKQVASDVTDRSPVGGVVRFQGALFVAGREVWRQGPRGFEVVDLPGFIPRLSRARTPTFVLTPERLWVVGPFGLWQSTDGQTFAPVLWR